MDNEPVSGPVPQTAAPDENGTDKNECILRVSNMLRYKLILI